MLKLIQRGFLEQNNENPFECQAKLEMEKRELTMKNTTIIQLR